MAWCVPLNISGLVDQLTMDPEMSLGLMVPDLVLIGPTLEGEFFLKDLKKSHRGKSLIELWVTTFLHD